MAEARAGGYGRSSDHRPEARLIEAARKDDARTELVVLLGADAGLRAGEIMALERGDVDFNRGHLRISRSEWRGSIRGAPREAHVTVIQTPGRVGPF